MDADAIFIDINKRIIDRAHDINIGTRNFVLVRKWW